MVDATHLHLNTVSYNKPVPLGKGNHSAETNMDTGEIENNSNNKGELPKKKRLQALIEREGMSFQRYFAHFHIAITLANILCQSKVINEENIKMATASDVKEVKDDSNEKENVTNDESCCDLCHEVCCVNCNLCSRMRRERVKNGYNAVITFWNLGIHVQWRILSTLPIIIAHVAIFGCSIARIVIKDCSTINTFEILVIVSAVIGLVMGMSMLVCGVCCKLTYQFGEDIPEGKRGKIILCNFIDVIMISIHEFLGTVIIIFSLLSYNFVGNFFVSVSPFTGVARILFIVRLIITVAVLILFTELIRGTYIGRNLHYLDKLIYSSVLHEKDSIAIQTGSEAKYWRRHYFFG